MSRYYLSKGGEFYGWPKVMHTVAAHQHARTDRSVAQHTIGELPTCPVVGRNSQISQPPEGSRSRQYCTTAVPNDHPELISHIKNCIHH